MAIGIKFRKDTADYLLDCLANGKPIEGIRNMNDYLVLAGACLLGAMSHCPKIQEEDRDSGSAELREAMEDPLHMDLEAAINLYCHLFMLVRDGRYDAAYEPEVEGWVEIEEGEPLFEPTKGKRE